MPTIIQLTDSVEYFYTSLPGDVGLKRAFGDDPVFYNVAIDLSFDTFGGDEENQDREFVKNYVHFVLVKTIYNEYKAK